MRKGTSGEGASGCKVPEFRFQPARGSSDLKPESSTAGIVYSEDVEMVTLPGIAGQMGIYPRHVPLISQMVPGEMIVHKDGRDSFVATGGGLIEVTANRVSILTDLAIPADRIDEAKAEKARQRAEARLREKLSDEQVAAVNASLTRALVQLRVTVA
jgi:F-type H+-transporting ATPase subunit epsilon